MYLIFAQTGIKKNFRLLNGYFRTFLPSLLEMRNFLIFFVVTPSLKKINPAITTFGTKIAYL